MPQLGRLISDTVGLLFPELCNACGTHLFHGEQEICTKCLYQLPYTDYHLYAHNRVAKQLWGRLPCNAAMAMLYFTKGARVQQLIHSLKYKQKTELGTRLGQLLGNRLKMGDQYQQLDLIVPVPLHPKKERERGYNQAHYIATGIAQVLGVAVSTQHLFREKATESQTRKTRYTRYENMDKVFNIRMPEELKNKHILLVDDVITTGATLEACGTALLNCGIKQLSIAAVAFAE